MSLPPLHPLLLSTIGDSPSPLSRLFLAAALTPYKNQAYTDAKGKKHPLNEAVLRDGLKLGTQSHYLDGIPALFSAAEVLKDLHVEQDRVSLGLLLPVISAVVILLIETE